MPVIKILLVDDDEEDFILTRELLLGNSRSQDYELTWCNKYSEAINAMLKEYYDIYLVDYRLGQYSGIDLLNEAVKSNCSQPIIILTGKGDMKIDEEALKLGAADYLVKDEINSKTLERSIRYALEHHKTLEKLRDSENKFRIIFERSKDPMVITDFYGKVYEVNTAAINFFEATQEELLRKNATEFYKDETSRRIFTTKMEQHGAVTDLELEFITSSGKVKFCSISSFLQITQHGNSELYYSIIHDLTYRKLQEQEEVLKEKLAAIELMAKNLASEIYNPLSNINLAVDELKNDVNQPDDLILFDIIKENCRKINKLTSELVESTQTTSVSKRKFNFYDTLKSAIAEAVYTFNIQPPALSVHEELLVLGDEQKLRFALLNILQNAAEASSGQQKDVSIEVALNDDELNLQIIDRGHGIADEDVKKIFEPFFSTKPKATGLGLTHSKRIILAHEGKIEVESRLMEGTTVTISLPLLIKKANAMEIGAF